jgi:hypothetical protein
MYNALKRLTSLVTMLLEWLVLRVRPSPGVFIAVVLIVVEPGALTRQLPPRASLDAQRPRSRAGRRGHVRPVRSRIRRTKLPLARPHPRTPLSPHEHAAAFLNWPAGAPSSASQRVRLPRAREGPRTTEQNQRASTPHQHARRLPERARASGAGRSAPAAPTHSISCSSSAPAPAPPRPPRLSNGHTVGRAVGGKVGEGEGRAPRGAPLAAPRPAPRPTPPRSTHLHTSTRSTHLHTCHRECTVGTWVGATIGRRGGARPRGLPRVGVRPARSRA